MKQTLTAVAAAVALALTGACSSTSSGITGTTATTGSGQLATESRPVGGFTAVSLTGAGHLVVEQTGVESLEITAEDNLLPLIRSEVVGDRLVLGFGPGVSVTSTREVLYRLKVRDLTRLEASGASRVELVGVDTPQLGTVLSGASALSASGRASIHEIVVSGASRCEAGDLSSQVVTAALSGASYAFVSVSDTLAAALSGASTLEYRGDPAVTTTEVSGGSVVRRVGP